MASNSRAPRAGASDAPAIDEVVALHRFFEAWFRGDLPTTDAAFARLDEALDPEFEMVGPGGTVTGRAPLLDGLRAMHGAHPAMSIRVERARISTSTPDVVILRYEEWQTRQGETRGRLSTVVFRDDADAPHGLVWVHLHEVWLP